MISQNLISKIIEFREERNWKQFHNLRTLSSSLVLEASELLELTQWSADSEIEQVVASKRCEIENEIADLCILITYITEDLGIEIESAVSSKLKINSEKYPISKAYGTSKKYTEFTQSTGHN